MSILQGLPQIVAAIGGLGTAAFGLVDATKAFGGGVNRIGFAKIESAFVKLTPGAPANGLTQTKMVDTLRANWYNGQNLASQKAVAKSLIKLNLRADNAESLANATGVKPDVLKSVATKSAAGTALASNESDVYSRFDLILTAMLDEVYQDSDQTYTNGTRVVASLFAVLLAFLAGWTVSNVPLAQYWWSKEMAEALIAGLLATPLAPVAKDLSSALAAAVNTMQLIKK